MRLAQEAVNDRGRFLLMLSGGSTPRPLYRLLADPGNVERFPWSATHVFWGDERAVAPDHPRSNYGQTNDVLLQHIPIPQGQIHRIRGEVSPAQSARAYAAELRRLAPAGHLWPRLDLVLLGLGSDGHTASLFPGSTFPVRHPQSTLAVSGNYGERPLARVTITPPVFNSARHVFFLVTGSQKAQALARTLGTQRDRVQWPAQRIDPREGTVTWFVDRAAAAKLDSEINEGA
jgi:6-phosphogluconolactonase